MRPLKLTMTAFGPYAGREVVDFCVLGENAFFLIHGPTGAGKTTILDAMCYALFGVTSGTERSGKQMRSSYVDPAVATEIIFDFALGGEVYRVRRQPEQEVLKKRGSGTTKLPPEATLWKRTGLAEAAAEGKVLAGKTNEVTAAVEELLGFKHGQFRQVVMLPQGEFRRLLLAGSSDREAIMETLFKTEEYRRIEEFFKQAAKVIEKEVAGLNDKKAWLLQEAGAASVDDLIVRLAGDTAEGLAFDAAVAEARLAAQTAQAALASAQRTQELFDEREAAKRTAAELAADKQVMQFRRVELAAARQAADVASVAEQADIRRGENDIATEMLTKAQSALTEAQAGKEAADAGLATAQGREAARQEAEQAVLQLKEMGDKLAQLLTARNASEQAMTRCRADDIAYAAAKGKLDQLKVEVESLKQERERILGEAMQVAAWETAAKEAGQLVGYRQELEKMRMEYAQAAKNQGAALKDVEALTDNLAAARRDLETLEDAWRHGQAGLLARRLEPGQPCPVCGSPHHPAPALPSAALASSEDLEGRRGALRRLEQELEGRRPQLSEAVSRLEVLKERGHNLRQLLGEAADAKLEDLTTTAAAVTAKLAAARSAGERLAEREAAISRLTNETRIKQGELEILEATVRERRAVLERASAVLEERESALPLAMREPGVLENEFAQAKARRDQLKAALETAQIAAQAAATKLAGCETAVKAAMDNAAAARHRLEEAEERLELRLKEAGFADIKDFLAARRSEEAVRILDESLNGYDKAVAVADDRVSRAAKAIEGLVPPDLPALETASNQAQLASDEVIAAQAKLKETINKQKAWLDQLKKLAEEMAGREQEYAVLGRLAEVAGGQNPQRVSFHRFVLQALLDDVMAAANYRLKKMSRGRYALRRMADPVHRGSAGGLDIEVEDSWTGATRHVATLSGGETFLASLSLALGLADVVQSYSGGIYLDTVFVDEGFGTLDPESLDMALQALIELQTGGRLVGVISHVPELKERIEARLEIVASDRGSTTRWSV